MYLDSQDSLILNSDTYIYEKFEVNLILSILQKIKDPVVIDVGAHIGYFTCIMSPYCSHVFAYEPDEINYNLLCKNIQLNNCTNVTTHDSAAGLRDAIIGLYRCANSSGMHRVFPSKWCVEKPVWVDCVRLNNSIEGVDYVSFMKLDAEGTEHEVLAGASHILEDCKPIILMEFHPDTIREFGKNPIDVLEYVSAFGYSIKTLPDMQIGKKLETIITEYDDASGGRNLLCEPISSVNS